MTETDARDVLQVTHDATPADIRRAYLDLVKVWHPDRFQSDARLQERAQRTLQQINDAYRLLENGVTTSGRAAPEPAGPIKAPEPGAAAAPGTAAYVWQQLRSPMLLPVCAGLALGVALTLTLILRSTPEPLAAPPDIAMPSAESPQTPEPASASPRRSPLQGPARPESGADVGPRGPVGRGVLSIRSALGTDGVVELRHDSGHRRRIYLRRGEKVTLLDLVPGSYRVTVATGTGWTGRWFDHTSATLERDQTVLAAPGVSGASTEALTLMPSDPSMRPTAPFEPD